ADTGFVHVDWHADIAAQPQDFPVITQVRARPHKSGDGTGTHVGGRNLVVEVILEQRQVEAGPVIQVPVDRDLAVDAGFGLQIGVADHRTGALPAKAADTVVQIGRLWRLVTGAYATLNGQIGGDVVDSVEARA